MTSMTVRATEDIEGITSRDAQRCKNLFALGLVSWMYGRPTEPSVTWIEKKFEDTPPLRDANLAAFRAGYNFGETAELLAVHYEIEPAPAPPGTYRNVNGTQALALGLIAASVQSGLGLFLASYPITPASELLHALSRHRRFGVHTIQAEDEIAAANMALGAAFSGRLAVTATSGPGMDLKAETIGLAVAMELPLLVVDIQRAGPSTGMPTKTEAADLLMALYGRHGESPLPVVAACTPSNCFDSAHRGRAHRGHPPHAGDPALRHLPGQLVRALAPARRGRAAGDRSGLRPEPNADGVLHALPARPEAGATLGGARHARPSPPHRRSREGGRDRQHLLRARQPRSHDAPAGRAHRADRGARPRGRRPRRGRLPARARAGGRATAPSRDRRAGCGARRGLKLATAHVRHLNPLPGNIESVLRSYERVLVPEMNMGQLSKLLRAEFLIDVESYTKVDGLPIFTRDVMEAGPRSELA